MLCNRCGREQPAHKSPCPECDSDREYHIRTESGERPIQIVDSHGLKVFSFSSADYALATEIARNLNTPASRWAA